EMAGQLFLNPRAVGISAATIFVLGLVPGLPTVPFLLVSGLLGGVAWVINRYKEEEVEIEAKRKQEEAQKPKKENIENLLPLDLVELEIGYGLINTVESERSGDLLERIVSIRKQFALDLGIVVPSVHIQDNLQLKPGEYRILIKGNKVAGGELKADCFLAMDPGNTSQKIDGIPTKEPAFGLDALWITKVQKEDAEIAGYTVVDLPTVIATHITEILRQHANELFGRQEASKLIDNFKKTYPKVVEDLIPDTLALGQVVRVLQNLLKEQVSIRDLLTIFETLADEGTTIKDTDVLTESVRKALGRSITSKLKDDDDNIHVINLGPEVEEIITQSLLQTEQGVQLALDPSYGHGLVSSIAQKIETHPEVAGQPVLLTSPVSRRHIFRLVNRFIPQLVVLSHSEVTTDVGVNTVGTVEEIHAS
ncbi:MAG: FHIPEP family type III secretion protein, partial [Bdellovibrionales bacterium]|nr:FHIPEP family type III secretion protein [Bdellovibrionales bacterium]NQZ19079.1 FHIPEP family type III secretion protein [Bdellovibrionales bacterium]